MTRDQLRAGHHGPVAVGGRRDHAAARAAAAERVGDDPDQLPVLQHALMRTWDGGRRRRARRRSTSRTTRPSAGWPGAVAPRRRGVRGGRRPSADSLAERFSGADRTRHRHRAAAPPDPSPSWRRWPGAEAEVIAGRRGVPRRPLVPHATGAPAARRPRRGRHLAREPDALLERLMGVGRGGARVGRPCTSVCRGKRAHEEGPRGCGRPRTGAWPAVAAENRPRPHGRGASTNVRPGDAFLDRSWLNQGARELQRAERRAARLRKLASA